jgi:hypothetical protein
MGPTVEVDRCTPTAVGNAFNVGPLNVERPPTPLLAVAG